MWLVLCDRTDHAALWAHRGLAARGLEPLELVTADALGYALRWEHRVGAAGASVVVELGDGRRIDGGSVRGVLNRLVTVPDGHLALARAADREYARQELFAFFVSWLTGLPGRVVNRATPQGLCGSWRHRSEWLALASAAGLETVPFRMNGDVPDGGFGVGAPARTVVIVEGEALGPGLPATVRAGCVRMAELAGATVLGVELAADGRVTGATPLPDLRLGGDRALDLLAAALR
jgi:hypothetical protein